MGRSDILSSTALEFLAKNRCAPEYPIERLREETEALRLPLSAVQLETVANLWNVCYWSRCSFAERRYRVAFFNPPRREGIVDFLVGFVSPESTQSTFVGDCDADEAHDPEGLVMDAGGALVTGLDPTNRRTQSSIAPPIWLLSAMRCWKPVALNTTADFG